MTLYELYNDDNYYIYTYFSDEKSEVQRSFKKCAHYYHNAGNDGVGV